MPSSVGQRRPGATRALARELDAARLPAAVAEADTWPHTRRPLPWLLAGFLGMIFLIPFDAIIFKVHLPANATLDRVFEVVMIAVFLGSRAVNGRRGPRRRLTPVEISLLVFGAIALFTIILNIDRIYQENQLSYTEKQFWQLLAYGVFFFVVVATVRPEEVPAFSRLIMALACVTAVGTLYESRAGINVFYLWSAKLLSPFAIVGAPATNGTTPLVSGPTQHPLALASMLTIALPFAVQPLLEARRPSDRLKYLVVIGLILAADLSTNRKTSVYAPLAALIVLTAYKRELLRWAPIAVIVLVPVIHFTAPGALGSIGGILPTSSSSNVDYTDGRAGDYPAVAPDILNNVIFGRGYGTLDILDPVTYRTLDNQYLDTLFDVGVIGLISYLAIVFCAMMTAHGVIKKGGVRAPPALAAAAGCAAFGLVSATYDAAGFPQAVYSFLFAAGLIAVVASKRNQIQPAIAPAVHGGNIAASIPRARFHPAGAPTGSHFAHDHVDRRR